MYFSELYPVALLCIFLTGIRGNIHCEEKEKALLDLDLAEHLIGKLKDLFSNCTNIIRNTSTCGVKVKVSVYLDKMKGLIEEARNNYPTCHPNVTEPVTEPHEYPKSHDCEGVMRSGRNVSGLYTIWPNSPLFKNRPLDVYCDMDTDLGGWTVIQRRGNFTPQEDFNRDWNDYREGFGNIKKDFWLGNENIFAISSQDRYEIRFDLESAEGEWAYASYDSFRIENETKSYRLRIGRFNGGKARSALTDGRSFATKDREETYACARKGKGGWWYYGRCGWANLNGPYNPGAEGGDWDFMYWYFWRNKAVGLAGSEIKIRPLRSF